jgi:phenylpyruvate tautomerase
MPYLAVTTNAEISAEAKQAFLKEASKAVAAGTGKPEQYVMVKLETAQPMIFAGTEEPTAFVELKSIGFSTGVQGLAASLCYLAAKHFGLPKERVFTVFQDVKAGMWGQGGGTFG